MSLHTETLTKDFVTNLRADFTSLEGHTCCTLILNLNQHGFAIYPGNEIGKLQAKLRDKDQEIHGLRIRIAEYEETHQRIQRILQEVEND